MVKEDEGSIHRGVIISVIIGAISWIIGIYLMLYASYGPPADYYYTRRVWEGLAPLTPFILIILLDSIAYFVTRKKHTKKGILTGGIALFILSFVLLFMIGL